MEYAAYEFNSVELFALFHEKKKSSMLIQHIMLTIMKI